MSSSAGQHKSVRMRFARHLAAIALGGTSMVGAGACGKNAAQSPMAQPAAETPATRQFNAWLSTFNSGDRGALVAYHDKFFPYDVASNDVHGIDNEHGLSQATGGFELKKPESPSATKIIAILKEKHSSQFARVEMEVDASEPHRVTRFEIHPIEPRQSSSKWKTTRIFERQPTPRPPAGNSMHG